MKIAIDLLWVRPNRVGGTEFYIRNLIEGFIQLEEDYEFVLLASEDNAETFIKYTSDKRFKLLVAGVKSAGITKRIIWQNLFQNRLLRKNHIKYCFVPVYCRPVFNGKVTYINTIHDIQARHYPNYHPFHEVAYTELCWQVDKWKSQKIVVTSSHVKEDLVRNLRIPDDKIKVLGIPVIVNKEEMEDFEKLADRYNIKKNEFYYTVAQMIPHKNLTTLIRVMAKIYEDKLSLSGKLLISGINGNATKEVERLIASYHLEESVILTGFVSNSERNTLYLNANAFLFPSVFEGFGIPPVEAMMLGAVVVTTRKTSIPEVTQNKANYVENPYDVDEWIKVLNNTQNRSGEFDLKVLDPVYLAQKYLDCFKQETV